MRKHQIDKDERFRRARENLSEIMERIKPFSRKPVVTEVSKRSDWRPSDEFDLNGFNGRNAPDRKITDIA